MQLLINTPSLTNSQALLAFSYFKKIGPVTMTKLENYFGTASSAFSASSFYLEKSGLRSSLVSEFIKWRETFKIGNAIRALDQENISYLCWHDDAYPKLLKEISSPPFILYYRGSLEAIDFPALAVVGSRQHSAYGEKIISSLLAEVIEQGITIISGLALGIDSLAHQATVRGKGRTIAVLGSGLNRTSIYPFENISLATKIINAGGLIISEFCPNTAPLKQNFPQRNRIISGLAKATLIIEAKQKSGSLITAAYALDQNREVLAVPGNIYSEFSEGPNTLIKKGAKTITCATEILEIYNLETNISRGFAKQTPVKVILENDIEKIIYKLIESAHDKGEKITSDEIAKLSELDTAVVNSTLSILEIRGVAKNDDFGYDIN